MTFEASRKKQVLVLQPRGKALYDDDSSFGSKMLRQMGWLKGQGLGKEQHGNIDFIQIRYKNNPNGLGYDRLKDNQWTKNESQFDNLLKSLNSKSDSSSNRANKAKREKIPLELKSEFSRVLHYKKFTRGKDVCNYSAKDLANILGKKSMTEVEGEFEQIEEEINDKADFDNSNLFVNTGLSTDYFKQKMQFKMNGANAVYSTNVIQVPSHVAQKISSMSVHNFKNANIANVVGYGLSEEIEIKTVQTKIGNVNNTDKYSLYNMDKMSTRLRVNPRKMFSKLKKTKSSIQVI